MRVYFEPVVCHGQKSGKCVVCGKRAVLKEKFEHTINPFSKNKDGTMKSREQVWQDVLAEKRAWEKEPIVHKKCLKRYREQLRSQKNNQVC